ncbi:MAG: polyketide synthase, partial [bacterium]|nr:polyketide synthase [bacterium]
FEVDSEKVADIREIETKTGATLYMIMLTVFYILLAKNSGQEDVVVGASSSGREHADLQQVIGMFVNMLALRNRPSADKTFAAFLKEVKENTLEDMENRDFQFDELVVKLGLQGETAGNPLFDAAFVLQNFRAADINTAGLKENSQLNSDTLKLSPYKRKNRVSRFDLLMVAVETPGIIRMNLEYSTELFRKQTAENFTKYYIEILEQVLENIEIQLKDITISHSLLGVESGLDDKDRDEFDF